MDSDRLGKLDENQLVERIDGIIKDIEQIKSPQFIGPDSLKPRILTTNQTDEPFQAVFTGTFYVINWSIDFYADTQANPYMLAFLEVYDPAGNPTSWSILNSYNHSQSTLIAVDDGHIQQFVIADSNVPWSFRLFVQASDSGRLSIYDYQAGYQVQ